MLEVKSPWNHETVGSVKTHNASEIEEIVQEVCRVSVNKGQDFPPKERINVLKSFIKIIENNTKSLAELATSEGGKPITDSIIEIKRGAEGVGALPRFTTNEMSYYLSWSTNGLINEYCNEADAIYEGKSVKLMPLEGAEKIVIEGESFEAFNTSGGCATMCETYENEVKNLSYKTIRYPGHLNHMKFLFNDLHLKKNKDVLEKLFDKEVPRTKNDVIIFFVKVIGLIDGVLQEKTYLRKIYGDEKFSAIQITTASGVCSVLKMYLDGKINSKGFTKQESLSWKDFLDNDFGKVYS